MANESREAKRARFETDYGNRNAATADVATLKPTTEDTGAHRIGTAGWPDGGRPAAVARTHEIPKNKRRLDGAAFVLRISRVLTRVPRGPVSRQMW